MTDHPDTGNGSASPDGHHGNFRPRAAQLARPGQGHRDVHQKGGAREDDVDD